MTITEDIQDEYEMYLRLAIDDQEYILANLLSRSRGILIGSPDHRAIVEASIKKIAYEDALHMYIRIRLFKTNN